MKQVPDIPVEDLPFKVLRLKAHLHAPTPVPEATLAPGEVQVSGWDLPTMSREAKDNPLCTAPCSGVGNPDERQGK